HDIGKSPDVRVVQWRIDLVEQAERRRIELEDREHERNRGQRLLAAGQQMNGAVPLARRPRHDRHARIEQILAVQLEIRMPAAEEAREEAAKPLIRLLERFLEARPGFPIDLANRLLEGLERLREILELRVEVLLALGLLLELVDRGEVDRAKALNLALDRLERLVPRRRRRVFRELREHLLELEAGFLKLLGHGLEADLRLPGREPHPISGLSSSRDGLLRLVAALLDLPKAHVERLDGGARLREPCLDGTALFDEAGQSAFVRRQRLDGRLELTPQLVAAFRQMLLLRQDAGERRARRLLRVAARLELDRKLVGDLPVMLRARSRLRDNRLMALSLRLELLPDAGKLVEHARGLAAPGCALLELRVEPLTLRRQLRDRLVQDARPAAQLLELAA